MKEIVVKIDDAAFQRAESIANEKNISVSALVEELVVSVTKAAHPTSNDLNQLFAALDKGRNTKSVAKLRREELHDRAVLHRY
ncbi:MAG TPA: DUF6364 family protein [Pyrinomonadaceae bacterium]|jgi:hypothetical protein